MPINVVLLLFPNNNKIDMKHNDKYHPSDQLLFRTLEEVEYELTSHKIVNIRSRSFPHDHRVHLHYHNTIEINVNHNVGGTVWIDGSAIPLDEINVLITPPGILHSFDFLSGDGTFDVLHISLSQLGEYINLEKFFDENLKGLKRIAFQLDHYRELEQIMEEMKDVSEDDLFLQLQLILKILKVIIPPKPTPGITKRNSLNLIKIIDYSEENFASKISLDDISSYVGLSRSYFSRNFKKMTGTGYFTYLKLIRLEKAKEKLRKGESVTESCYSCGFDNLSYFIQLFKKNNNDISPGKYSKMFTHN